MTSMRITVNITKWQIFRLSIPIFFSNLAIPLVGIVDTGLMGHLEREKFLIPCINTKLIFYHSTIIFHRHKLISENGVYKILW